MKNKKAQVKSIVFLIIGVAVLIGILIATSTGLVTKGDSNSLNKKIPLEIANLTEFNGSNYESYTSYTEFAQHFNDLITILNNQKIFDIPKLDISQSSYEGILKFITKYGPLVNNYNLVVSSAKTYNQTRSNADLETFYGNVGNFAFELTLISSAVFYTPSYRTVGAVYRASGLQYLAPRCPGCVSVALSTAHWTIRNGLVELSSQVAQNIENKPKNWDSITIDSLKKSGEGFLDKSKEIANNTISAVKNYNYTEAGKNIADKTKNFIGGIFNN